MTDRTVQGAWFVRLRPAHVARLRLFCFPYAGVGSSVYRPWAHHLPGDVDLCAFQPPGRESRLREPPVRELELLVAAAAEHVKPMLDVPAVFFGHSMGALLAFELARTLTVSEAGPVPRLLIVSARRPPGIPDREPQLHHLADDDFVSEIQRRYGGIPQAVLENRELLDLLLPALRADVTALERYRCRDAPPLSCPVLAVGGTQDPRVTRADLEGWRSETTGPFSARLFDGGHFYLQRRRLQLLQALSAALRPLEPELEALWTGP